MGDDRRERNERPEKENPQDERKGGYGAPAEREEEMKREAPEKGERGKDD